MFTDEEAKVYDRQIRLWGIHAQQKIRAADVLIIRLDGLATEIIKNLVLAGINSITIMDDKPVTQYDMLSNLFTRNQIGMNRAEACQKAINDLNPMVKVNIEKDSLSTILLDETKAKNFLKLFNVVILVNDGLNTAIKLNELCRQLCIPFFFACSWGYLSMVFIDVGNESKNGMKYVPIGEAFERKTISLKNQHESNKISNRDMKKIENLKNHLLVILVLFRYYEKTNAFPLMVSDEIDDELRNLEKEILDELNTINNTDQKLNQWSSTKSTKILNDWTKKIYGQFTFISSIVGGFLAQDVIRTITNDENSIDYNTFLFYDINGHNFNIGIL